jgi:ribonuclease Z
MFDPRLINDPFGDPGVFVEIKYRREALLFDLGDLQSLYPRSLLKIRQIFVSHTHMDHFIGFDHLIRVCLGRNQTIALYGPLGFLRHVENRLGSYNWNLVQNYVNNFRLEVTEVLGETKRTCLFDCRKAFRREGEAEGKIAAGILRDDPVYRVRTAILDHRIPCLAFALEEKFRVNIRKDVLESMGIPPGPWLTALKEKIVLGAHQETPVRASWQDESDGSLRERYFTLGELREKLVLITRGMKIAYITDAIWTPENEAKMAAIAEGADLLFIEAPFLHEDEKRAADKYHLTARQAGHLARKAGVKRMSLFHFSPKYQGLGERLREEAARAFSDTGEAT